MKKFFLKALVLGTILLLGAPVVQARYTVDCDGCGHAIEYDLAGDLYWSVPSNANFSDGSLRTSNSYYRQLEHNRALDQNFRKLSGNPTRRGAVAATVCGTGEYQYCDGDNFFDMRLANGNHLYQLLIDTVSQKAYVNYGQGVVRQIMFGVQHFRDAFPWEAPYEKGSPWCSDSIQNYDDPCPDNWDIFSDKCPEIAAADTTTIYVDSSGYRNDLDGGGDNLRLGIGQGTYYDLTIITDCDTVYETGHTAGGDTLFRDFRLHCDPESRKPDTVFLVNDCTPQGEGRFDVELGQLTKLKIKIGGLIPINEHVHVAVHGGLLIAPYMLDYGKPGTPNQDKIWERGYFSFLGDVEVVYTFRSPEKKIRPAIAIGLEGEFGATELSGPNKSPSNIFSPVKRINFSPYIEGRLVFGNVSFFVGWSLTPADYYNRWEYDPSFGGDGWWGGVRMPDARGGIIWRF